MLVGVSRTHDKRVNNGAFGITDPLDQVVNTEVIHEEADRPPVHAINSFSLPHETVQDLQHQSISAQCDNDVGLFWRYMGISLAQLYKSGLRFRRAYASLDAESTGTAITLKVVFLAHLLRDLFRRTDIRLLIFVDEVDTLDDMNQETIRECARELGFTLIMASPNPANARRLYFLRPEGKVTYIYPEESLEVIFRDEPELEEEPVD